MGSKDYRPGQKAPISGQYGVYGPRGGYRGEITSTKGHTLPPSDGSGVVYRPLDGTDNGSGKAK